MKQAYLLLIALGWASVSFGQKMEYGVQLNAGLSRYAGEGSTKATLLFANREDVDKSITRNPYGQHFAFSYGASFLVQRVSASNFLLGVNAGVDVLRTKVDIDRVQAHYPHLSSYPSIVPASGHTNYQNSFINLHPYLGRRFQAGALDVDITLGSDVGFGMGSKEKGNATTQDGDVFSTKLSSSSPAYDFRPRAGITAYRGNVGVSVSYAHGISNYQYGRGGTDGDIHMRVLRLGLIYSLRTF
jgi:hypothetical protein